MAQTDTESAEVNEVAKPEASDNPEASDKPESKVSEAKPAQGDKDSEKAPKTEKPQGKDGQEKIKKEASPVPNKVSLDEKPAEEKEPAKSAPRMEDPRVEQEWISKGVWLSPPKEGPAALDFSLVGEYLGEVRVSSDDPKRLGIQIRALGDGRFEARGYQGGLPGQEGSTEDHLMVLVGRRNGDTLVLSGGPWAMFAGPRQCKVIDSEGEKLGTLPRVKRSSPTLGAGPPEGAMVLFNGQGTDALVNGKMTPGGLLSQGADINFLLSDFDLHVEFRIPHMPKFDEQKRGNSGLYLQSRYECQVLDSFGAPRVINGLGALYRHRKPDLNMAFPPLVWQTYDVHFTAARFAANGKKLRNAHVTSWVNGVKVQDEQSLPSQTGHGKDESPTLLPTKLQDHGDPVRYRNVWVIDRGLVGGVQFPPTKKVEAPIEEGEPSKSDAE